MNPMAMARAWAFVAMAPFALGVLLHCGGTVRSDVAQDGGAGTGSGGSSSADICQLPMVSGPCDAAIPAYWHDPVTGVCMPFTYGGCDGNANNFRSLEACQTACSSGKADMDTCTGPEECGLVGASCWEICNPNSLQEFVAVNRNSAIEFITVAAAMGSVAVLVVQRPSSNRRSSISFQRAKAEGAASSTSGRPTSRRARPTRTASCA